MRTHSTPASCSGDTGRVRVLLGWVGLALSERDAAKLYAQAVALLANQGDR